MKVLSIFGTRPEAIKMAPVIRTLAATPGIESLVCVTAQHRQMLDQVLELFRITPDVDLNLMRPDQSLSELTAAIFTQLDPVVRRLAPDWILVQGDTTTAMATALLAHYHRIKIGHVEAGLRTGDKWQPFPEETNRRVISLVADLNFAPTAWAQQNLLAEGAAKNSIVVTGNTVIDALRMAAGLPEPPATAACLREWKISPCEAGEERTKGKRLVLVTAHRRENFGAPLENICAAIHSLAETYAQDIHFAYPVHLNPNVREPVQRMLGNIPNVSLLPPMDYLPWVHLLKHAALLLTDSGGLQEEAPGFGIPVLVLRAVTERPEGVQAGTVRLAGTDAARIIAETRCLLDDRQAYQQMSRAANPYGDGHAAERIVKVLRAGLPVSPAQPPVQDGATLTQ